MTGPILAFILFCLILCIGYYFHYYFSFIPKVIYLSLSFMLLIIPQYTDYIPNYIFTKTQMLNYNLNEENLYSNKLTKKQKKLLINNQMNECKICKTRLKKPFYIKKYDILNNHLSSYYVICNRCNEQSLLKKIKSNV